jgi:formate dehydrogenase accessory protein FdhE
MAISEEDRRILQALVEARQQHEELVDFLDFYEALYRLQFEAKEKMAAPEVRSERARRQRLEDGLPQLTFDQLDVNPAAFKQLVERITDVLIEYNPEWGAGRQELNAEEWLSLAETALQSGKMADPSLGPAALAVSFALSPHLQKAAEVIMPHLDQSLWHRGYCPVCGGLPSFAVLIRERGSRYLLCSRCNSQWLYKRIGCPFCGARAMDYYPSEDGVYRLYVCDACKSYLKTIDLRNTMREICLPVENLVTVSMDLAARREGYSEGGRES